jgi:hypothetical protein
VHNKPRRVEWNVFSPGKYRCKKVFSVDLLFHIKKGKKWQIFYPELILNHYKGDNTYRGLNRRITAILY